MVALAACMLGQAESALTLSRNESRVPLSALTLGWMAGLIGELGGDTGV